MTIKEMEARTGFLIVIGTQPEPLHYTTDGGRLSRWLEQTR